VGGGLKLGETPGAVLETRDDLGCRLAADAHGKRVPVPMGEHVRIIEEMDLTDQNS
jgi:hypothetical protein